MLHYVPQRCIHDGLGRVDTNRANAQSDYIIRTPCSSGDRGLPAQDLPQSKIGRSRFQSVAAIATHDAHEPLDASIDVQEDAFPDDPDLGNGWEKLCAEELCRYRVSKPKSFASESFCLYYA